jgi:hypothetical protein
VYAEDLWSRDSGLLQNKGRDGIRECKQFAASSDTSLIPLDFPHWHLFPSHWFHGGFFKESFPNDSFCWVF